MVDHSESQDRADARAWYKSRIARGEGVVEAYSEYIRHAQEKYHSNAEALQVAKLIGTSIANELLNEAGFPTYIDEDGNLRTTAQAYRSNEAAPSRSSAPTSSRMPALYWGLIAFILILVIIGALLSISRNNDHVSPSSASSTSPSISFLPTITLTSIPSETSNSVALATHLLLPTFTLTPSKTPAGNPINTSLPQILPTSTPICTAPVEQKFLVVWSQLQNTLGCPGQQISTSGFAYQNFLNGKLIWRGLELDYNNVIPQTDGTALALFSDKSSWELIQSAKYKDGDPPYTCPELRPQNSSFTPIRGFAKLLCNAPDVRSELGNAISSEQGYPTSFVQEFTRGFLLHYDTGGKYTSGQDVWQTLAFFYGTNFRSGTWQGF